MTILIVDDEYYIREDLLEILQPLAKEEDLTIVTAEDGMHALEQALLTPPDLLISDVQMHRMNGLELAEQIQKMMPDCRTIFLSNYSDKEYLKSAIHLHAVEYLEKPVEPENLTALIRRQIYQYRKKLSSTQQRDAAISKNIKNAKVILSQLISQLLRSKNANLESVCSQCEIYGMSYLFTSAYRCLLFRVNQHLSSDFVFPNIPNVHMLPPDYSEKGILILILYADKPELLNDDCIRTFWDSLHRFKQITGLGVGPVAKDYRSVFCTWQIAQEAFSQLFFSANPQIIFLERQNDTRIKDLGQEAINMVFSALSALKLSQKEIELFFAALQKQTITPLSDIRNYFCMTADLILQYSAENLLTFHKNHTNFELYQEIWAATDLKMLEQIINSWVNELLIQGEGDDRIVRITSAYIHKHYNDTSLSLDSLCDYTGYSRSYLSTIFNQITGTNINTYINKVRIENACHLLKTTDKPLKDIAMESGFSGQSYFGKIFKSITGMTPKKFKSQ